MAGLFKRFSGGLTPGARLQNALERARAGAVAEVFAVLAEAAQRGDTEAQFWVGKAYLDGAGVPSSRATAAKWLERAASAAHVEAQATLARVYLTGAAKDGAEAPGLFADNQAIEPDFEQ